MNSYSSASGHHALCAAGHIFYFRNLIFHLSHHQITESCTNQYCLSVCNYYCLILLYFKNIHLGIHQIFARHKFHNGQKTFLVIFIYSKRWSQKCWSVSIVLRRKGAKQCQSWSTFLLILENCCKKSINFLYKKSDRH